MWDFGVSQNNTSLQFKVDWRQGECCAPPWCFDLRGIVWFVPNTYLHHQAMNLRHVHFSVPLSLPLHAGTSREQLPELCQPKVDIQLSPERQLCAPPALCHSAYLAADVSRQGPLDPSIANEHNYRSD